MKHPMHHGRPVLIGDLILYEGFLYDATGTLDSGYVQNIRWIRHREEIWIHTVEHTNLCIPEGHVREIVKSSVPVPFRSLHDIRPPLPVLHMDALGPLSRKELRALQQSDETYWTAPRVPLCFYSSDEDYPPYEAQTTHLAERVNCRDCWEDMK